MSGNHHQAREILAHMIQQHTGHATDPEMLQPVSLGASGRSIMRAHGVLGIHWTGARADNNSFLPAARRLQQAGVPVPTILDEQLLPDHCGACLVEDLGQTDILSLKEGPQEDMMAAYRSALDALLLLSRTHDDGQLQPPFDAALYRWEQEYFAEHLLARHLGEDASAFLQQPALTHMATWLASLPRVPVHRDFQSQNIMWKDGQAWLIDFQGMRMGRTEYDLASLLYDPYMELTQDERSSLLSYWEQISGDSIDSAIFAACAMQRLMQALGAFANIGYNMGKEWYLQRIPAGLAALQEVVANTPTDSPAAPVAACLAVK